jgi:hypothetical protein
LLTYEVIKVIKVIKVIIVMASNSSNSSNAVATEATNKIRKSLKIQQIVRSAISFVQSQRGKYPIPLDLICAAAEELAYNIDNTDDIEYIIRTCTAICNVLYSSSAMNVDADTIAAEYKYVHYCVKYVIAHTELHALKMPHKLENNSTGFQYFELK